MSNAYVDYVTSDTTVDPGYDTFLIDASSNSVTMTLPSIVGDGTKFTFVRIDTVTANTVTVRVDPTTSEVIDLPSQTSITLDLHKNTTLCSFYANLTWYTIYGNRT